MEIYCAVNNFYNFNPALKNQYNVLKTSDFKTYKGKIIYYYKYYFIL